MEKGQERGGDLSKEETRKAFVESQLIDLTEEEELEAYEEEAIEEEKKIMREGNE